jgi:3'-phosphoadenosine 5'-phosphosulfate sulfotransferase (PAPS reductase)/FAD synthetase
MLGELDLGINDPLAMSNEDVAHLTRPEREERLDALIGQSRDLLSAAIEEHVTNEGLMVAALAVGFSGGNDSTTLTHLFRQDVDFALHANTTIGIEETREFVRNTCEEWGLALMERTPPRETDRYRHLVLTRQRGKKGQALGGFPGPAMHFKMYQRLKERAIEQVQREVISNPRRERFVVILGRRRTESQRRSRVHVVDRRGSRLNVSPLVNWTKADLNTYRLRCASCGKPLPRNVASDLIHMSGECLCGSFASPGERAEIAYWFPGPFEQIAELETALSGREDIPEHRKTWGWGADPVKKAAETAYLKLFDIEEESLKSGLMCSSCDGRFQMALTFEESA